MASKLSVLFLIPNCIITLEGPTGWRKCANTLSDAVVFFFKQNAHNVLVASSPVAHYGLVAKVADLGLARVLGNATAGVTQTVRASLQRSGCDGCWERASQVSHATSQSDGLG